MLLIVENNEQNKTKFNEFGFSISEDNTYAIDQYILDHADLADKSIPENWMIANINIVPYTVHEDELVFFGFGNPSKPSIYITRFITEEDFVPMSNKDDTMSFGRTLLGIVIEFLDQPNLGMSLNYKTMGFPEVVADAHLQPLFLINVEGDNHEVIHEMVSQMGPVIGHITSFQITNKEVEVDGYSSKIVAHCDKKKRIAGAGIGVETSPLSEEHMANHSE